MAPVALPRQQGRWLAHRIGLRTKLLVPFLVIPLVALVLVGGASWWVAGRAMERDVDRALGDKLELAVEVVRRIGREHLVETARLAADPSLAARRRGSDLDLVAVKKPGQPLRPVGASGARVELPALEARLAALWPLSGSDPPRLALVATGAGFLFVATAPLGPGPGAFVAAKRLTRELLTEFSGLSGAEMGLFAGWQRAAVSAFAVDLSHCRNCHDADWRVERISTRFHAARSFKERRYFTTSLADGFRYAFMPLELDGRRVAMVVVRQPLEAAVTDRRQTLALTAGGGALALVLSLGVWWLVSREITRPITALQRWMDSLGQGGVAPAPRISTRDEVQRLAESMSATVVALGESRGRVDTVNAELRQMVERQSSRLSSMEGRLRAFLDLADAPETMPDPEDVGGHILRQLAQLFGCASARIVFHDPADEDVVRCLALSSEGVVERSRFEPSRDLITLPAASRPSVPFRLDPSLAPEGVRGHALVVPLTLRGQRLGVVVLGERRSGAAYAGPDLETLATLVQQGAMALEHAFLYAHSQEAYLQTTFVLVKTIEEKDPYLRGHSDRVARTAVATARGVGLTDGALKSLGLLARLHDVGKICIDSSILQKPGRLTAEEFDAIKRHVEIGEAIVRQIVSLGEQAFVVGQHHERYDGKGYVAGLGGDEISVEARVIAVCDSFDAMTSARPYRAPLPARRALEEITRGAGSQFDPGVAAAFVEALTGDPVLRAGLQAAGLETVR